MSDYLKNLQESVVVQHSFIRNTQSFEYISSTDLLEELREELRGIFETKEELNDFIGDFFLSEYGSSGVASLKQLMQMKQSTLYNLKKHTMGTSKYEDLRQDLIKYNNAIAKAKGGVANLVKQGAEKTGDVASQAGEKVAGAVGKVGEFAQQHGGVLAAAAAAAAAIAAGVMAYRRFFSKAAQACKGAADRSSCLQQYKVKAKQAQISAINAGKAKCAKTKDPAKCKAKIDAKIAGLKSKMRG